MCINPNRIRVAVVYPGRRFRFAASPASNGSANHVSRTLRRRSVLPKQRSWTNTAELRARVRLSPACRRVRYISSMARVQPQYAEPTTIWEFLIFSAGVMQDRMR
jgi:hypothetical protein